MDFETSLICAGIVAVCGAVVVLTSWLGVREKSYEEAVLEQRRRANVDALVDQRPAAGKGATNKRDKNKEKKDKKAAKKQQQKVVAADNVEQPTPTAVVDAGPTSNQEVPVVVETPTEHPQHKQHEHVEFQPVNQIVFISEEEDAEQLGKRRVSREDKPRKPILVHKNSDQTIAVAPDEPAGARRKQRGNSFDIVHPKDEFELIKHQEEKRRSQASSREDIRTVGEESPAPVVNGYHHHGETNGDLSGSDQHFESASSIGKAARKGKKSKALHATAGIHSSGTSNISTPTQLIQAARNLQLNNDEVQSIVNELLNRQTDEPSGSTQWTQKNDPVSALKRELKEKESILLLKSDNLEAAKARLHEVRKELDQQKSREHGLQQQINVLNQERQSYDSKIRALCDENGRLMSTLKKVENERPTPEVVSNLKIELDKLRADRQQFERHNSTLEKGNQELRTQIVHLEEALKALKGNRQKDEVGYQKQIGEATSQLHKSELEKSALQLELDKLNSQCNSLESENISLRQRTDELLQLKEELSGQLQTKVNELNKVRSDLKEAESREPVNGSADHIDKGQYEKLQVDLDDQKQQLNKAQAELSQERATVTELREKGAQSERAFTEANKLAAEKLADAVREAEQKTSQELSALQATVGQLEQRLSDAETAKASLQAERDELSKAVNQLREQQAASNAADNGEQVKELAELRDKYNAKNEECEKIRETLETFKTSLSNTDDKLKQLEQRVQDEERDWTQRLEKSQTECEHLQDKNKQLENTIKDLQGLSQTVIDMEVKLKDLQQKLQGEEQEKKVLVNKYEEVSHEEGVQATNKASTVQEQLDKRTKEFEELDQSRAEIERVKAEAEQLRSELERDRKLLKEAQAQNIKLNSLVKIGQDSIKAEQDRVNDLTEQLKLRNGGALLAASTPNLSSNGTNGSVTQQALNNSSNSLNVSSEGASNK